MEPVDLTEKGENAAEPDKASTDSKVSEPPTRSPSTSNKRAQSLAQSRRRGSEANLTTANESEAALVSRAASNVLVSGMNLTRDLSRSIKSQLPQEVLAPEERIDEKYVRDEKWNCDSILLLFYIWR
jgi:hypothetical protein